MCVWIAQLCRSCSGVVVVVVRCVCVCACACVCVCVCVCMCMYVTLTNQVFARVKSGIAQALGIMGDVHFLRPLDKVHAPAAIIQHFCVMHIPA